MNAAVLQSILLGCVDTRFHPKKARIPSETQLDRGPSDGWFVHPWSRKKTAQDSTGSSSRGRGDVHAGWQFHMMDVAHIWQFMVTPPSPPNNLALHWLTTTFKPELLAAELSVLKSPVPCCQWYFCSCLEPMLLFPVYFELLDKKQSSSIEPTYPLWKEDVHKQTNKQTNKKLYILYQSFGVKFSWSLLYLAYWFVFLTSFTLKHTFNPAGENNQMSASLSVFHISPILWGHWDLLEHSRSEPFPLNTSQSIKTEDTVSKPIVFLLFFYLVLEIKTFAPLPSWYIHCLYPLSSYNSKLKFIEFQHVH